MWPLELVRHSDQVAHSRRLMRVQIQAAEELLPRSLWIALLAECQPELIPIPRNIRGEADGLSQQPGGALLVLPRRAAEERHGQRVGELRMLRVSRDSQLQPSDSSPKSRRKPSAFR